jgi:hypothetical protein
MAKELSKSGISTGQDILAGHVTQSIDAFTGTEAYDVTVSGSLTVTGSTFIQPTNISTGTNVLTVDSDGKIYKTGSYSAGGGTTPTWQQVTDQGASTTNDLTITGNITASNLIITASNFAVTARGAGDDIIHLAAGVDSDIYIKGDDYIRLNNNQIRITGSITASANISASGIVYAETGSFSHLQGNSPITVGDSTTFQQSITASGDISASGFLFITASEFDPASQILTFNTESGAVHYANFHISTSTSTNTIGDDNTDLDFKGPSVAVVASADFDIKAPLTKFSTLAGVQKAHIDNTTGNAKFGDSSVYISASGDISASGTASAAYFVGDGSGLTNLPASNPFPFTGDAQITGSLIVSGSFIPHGVGPTSNTVIGESAGASLTVGSTENIMIGKEAGEAQASGDSNIMIGVKAGEASTNDSRCILIGRKAGGGSTLGSNNIFLGFEAGRDANAVNDSIGIGYQALFESNNGAGFNLGIGKQVGYSLTTGTYNVLLGHQAGYNLTTGASNIIIGSGSLAETGTTNQLRIGNASLIAISASLTTGDIILQGDVSSSIASTASFGQYKGQKLEIRGLGGGLSSGYIADSAGAGDMKFGIGTDSPTEVLDVAGGIKASMDLTARNATFSGSLVVSGSSSILMTSGSSTQTFGVGGYYKTRWGQADADFTFFSDDYINLLWNEAGSDDIEGQIKTNPSSGEVHIITNNDGAYTYLDRQVSDGVFDIDSNLGNDENLEFTIGSPMDNSYPFYRVTIRSANTAGAGAGVTCLIEKFT